MVDGRKQNTYVGTTQGSPLSPLLSNVILDENEKLRELIPRGTHHIIFNIVTRLNTWYRGWSGYYGMTEDPKQLQKIEAHARRRLRAKIVYDHKRPNNLRRTLMKRGVSSYSANKIINNMGIWATSKTNAMHKAYPNRYFIKDLGQYVY